MKIKDLTIKDLARLCRDFQVDCFDGFVSNDESYIESWLQKRMFEQICKVCGKKFKASIKDAHCCSSCYC